MDVRIRLLLKDGHVEEFCCDEDDSILFGLVSALPGAEVDANLPPDSLIQIDARGGKRIVLTRSSLVAVQVSPEKNLVLEHPEKLQESQQNSPSPTPHQRAAVIDVAVTTVARQADYIHQLISNLRTDLPLRLIVGSPDRDYLSSYAVNPHIDVIEAPLEEWERFKDCSLHQRAAWNYWRALTLGAHSPNRKGLVIFEDDVVVAIDWERRVHSLIDQIEARQSGPYILALYAAAESGLKPAGERQYVSYPPQAFFGNQAIYYPEHVRQGYAAYLKEHGVDAFSAPYDFLLSDYSQSEQIPIFAAIPCLVEHIGEISTGLAQFFHQSVHA
jgi:hypothetical protein